MRVQRWLKVVLPIGVLLAVPACAWRIANFVSIPYISRSRQVPRDPAVAALPSAGDRHRPRGGRPSASKTHATD